MKPKRKVFWQVEHADPLWWNGKEWSTGAGCNVRRFSSAKRANNHFETLPKGSTLTKFALRKGRWYYQTWEKL